MAETRVVIEGMNCQHCVTAVEKALEGVLNILESNVQIGSASVNTVSQKSKRRILKPT